jgi:hypothetical protein
MARERYQQLLSVKRLSQFSYEKWGGLLNSDGSPNDNVLTKWVKNACLFFFSFFFLIFQMLQLRVLLLFFAFHGRSIKNLMIKLNVSAEIK